MNKKEKLWNFIEKHKFIIFFMIITALSLYIRRAVSGYISDDYNDFLGPWFEALKNNRRTLCVKREYR